MFHITIIFVLIIIRKTSCKTIQGDCYHIDENGWVYIFVIFMLLLLLKCYTFTNACIFLFCTLCFPKPLKFNDCYNMHTQNYQTILAYSSLLIMIKVLYSAIIVQSFTYILCLLLREILLRWLIGMYFIRCNFSICSQYEVFTMLF